MLELLKAMLREEIRLHEALFDRRFFFAFPVVILVVSYFMSSFLAGFLGGSGIFMAFMGLFFVYGLMVGSFGLHARDALSIRFNDLSLLVYSSRTLPVSRRYVLFMFAVQDLIYYFLLTVLPFSLGALRFLAGVDFFTQLFGFFTVFFFGISVSFLVSGFYLIFGKLFLFGGALALYVMFLAKDAVVSALLGVIELRIFFFAEVFGICLVVLYFSFMLFDADVGVKRSLRFRESFKSGFGFFSRFSGRFLASFAAKDMIDMSRTSGGFSKIVFSYLFPSALLWVVFDAFLSGLGLAMSLSTFAVVLGVVSTSIYNWLCQYDRFSGYSIYPVVKRDVIMSKVMSFALISSGFSIVALVGVGVLRADFAGFFPAVVVMMASSFYALAVLVRVAGLEPNAMLYDVRVMVRYFAYCLPVLVGLVTLTFFGDGLSHLVLFFSFILIIIGIKLSYSL